jgi:hypothetical protein
MIRIAITPQAFDAIAAIMPLGSSPSSPRPKSRADVHIRLEPSVINKLRFLRGPGESLSDVILRLAKGDRRGPKKEGEPA